MVSLFIYKQLNLLWVISPNKNEIDWEGGVHVSTLLQQSRRKQQVLD